MPVTGLPMMLECIINNILQESQLNSYKIAGSQDRVTVILRFDQNNMADSAGGPLVSSVNPDHFIRPSSVGFRRKAPSQLRRDAERSYQHRASFTSTSSPFLRSNNIRPTLNDFEKTEVEATPISFADSAIGPEQSSAILSPKIGAANVLSVEKSGPDVNNTGSDTTSGTDSSSDASTGSDTEIDTPLTTEEEPNKNRKCVEPADSFNTYVKENDTRKAVHAQTFNNVGKQDTTTQHNSNYSSECNNEELKDFKEMLSRCAKDQIQNMDNADKIRASQCDRNNSFSKVVLEYKTEIILAETSDFIIEYDARFQLSGPLKNIYLKDTKQASTFDYEEISNKRQMRDWPDATEEIDKRSSCSTHYQKLKKLLPCLKELLQITK